MESAIILSDIQKQFRSQLASYYPDQEIRQIFRLVTEVLLNYSKIDTILKGEEPISANTLEKFHEVLNRLRNWEPIQYILGRTWFYGHIFEVDKRVLIPRQETEELVQWIIRSEAGKTCELLDLGTGSGCIAVSLALNLPLSRVSACDISSGSLEIAARNATINMAMVSFYAIDLLDDGVPLPEKYGIMVSNPPYVREQEKSLMQRNVLDHEPPLALFVPDGDPLIFYKRIALLGRKFLLDGGSLYFEINEHFPDEMIKLLKNTGYFAIEVKKDINGKSRMVRARK
jgi:release factor glutamine methyltransferase